MTRLGDHPDDPPARDRVSRAGLAGVRVLVGLLWLQNSGWKTPPDFGRDAGRGLYRFTTYAVEHEVFGPFAWVVENLVLPNFTFFGWMTLLLEAALGAFLVLGLFTRFWTLVGLAQTTAITLSVLNAPNEWSWAYYLMAAAHVALFATASGRVFGLDGLLRPLWSTSRTRPARLALVAS